METTEQLAIDADTLDASSSRGWINHNNINNNNSSSTSGFSFTFLGGILHNNNNNNNNNIKNNPEKSVSSTRDVTRKPSSKITEVVAGGYTNDRYRHDVEQAKLMRKGMERRKQQQQQQQNFPPKDFTEADINLAFEGLEQVESLRQQGNLPEAIKISKLSLELLIQFLRSDPSVLPNVDREMVGHQVQLALTSAEEMKEALSNRSSLEQQKQHQPSQISTPAGHGSESGGKNSLTKSLSQALAFNHTRNQKKDDKSGPGMRRQSKSRPPSLQSAGQTTTSSPPTRKTTEVKGKSLYRHQPVAKPTSKVAESRHVPSSLVSSADPMVQTIKDELYVDPSQLQSTTWQDIAGLEDAKQALQEAAILPLMRPDLFCGLRRPRNILLYGPPGTGKTMLVKAVAHESRSILFLCTASAMTSKWLGEGEKLIRALFRVARESAPSIIFVDEMDALLSVRKSEGEHEASRRFKTEFMTQMDGIVKGAGDNHNGRHLLVIAATNCPWDIDSAVLRRFPRRIYIPLPDSITRNSLLTNLLEKSGQYDMGKRDVSAIVKRLDGFSGSDIAAIASEASFGPLRSLGGIDAIKGAKSSDIRPIQRQDFETAIDHATKSVSKSLLKKYDQWKEEQAAS
jgi:SpoVK/Ycf46/Vps4 family AAA+-type ATPase